MRVRHGSARRRGWNGRIRPIFLEIALSAPGPAFWRVMREMTQHGRAVMREVSLCGDLASDVRHLPALLRSGLRTLSVAPAALADWYRSLTCYVNASYGEGFGLHLLEAMGCGVPLISTTFSAVGEVFDAGVGYEVSPSFTVELAYRYLNLGDGRTGTVYNYAGQCRSCEAMTFKNIDSHDVKLGLRWSPGTSAVSTEHAPLVRRY